MDSLRLPDTNPPVLACNVGCGYSDPLPDHPSLLRLSALRHDFSAVNHTLDLNTPAPDHWRYIGGPF